MDFLESLNNSEANSVKSESEKVKMFCYDTETTGLCEKSPIHQLYGEMYIDGVIVDKIDIKMKPFEGAEIADRALEVGNVTLEQINAYPSERDGYLEFTKFLKKYINPFVKTDKAILMGYNIVKFDNVKLKEWFDRMGDKYLFSFFNSRTEDVMILAQKFLTKDQTESFKLMDVCKALDLGWDDKLAHEASYDTIKTIEARNALIKYHVKLRR